MNQNKVNWIYSSYLQVNQEGLEDQVGQLVQEFPRKRVCIKSLLVITLKTALLGVEFWELKPTCLKFAKIKEHCIVF